MSIYSSMYKGNISNGGRIQIGYPKIATPVTPSMKGRRKIDRYFSKETDSCLLIIDWSIIGKLLDSFNASDIKE